MTLIPKFLGGRFHLRSSGLLHPGIKLLFDLRDLLDAENPLRVPDLGVVDKLIGLGAFKP